MHYERVKSLLNARESIGAKKNFNKSKFYMKKGWEYQRSHFNLNALRSPYVSSLQKWACCPVSAGHAPTNKKNQNWREDATVLLVK